MSLWVNETYVNETEGHIMDSSEPYETWCDTIGELFSAMMQEHGRCVSRMYVDTKDGKTKQVGWVFEKRQGYEDIPESFLARTWVSVHKAPPMLVERHWKGGESAFQVPL